MSQAVQWPATSRYTAGGDVAPDGLGFVEDLLNTASHGKPAQPDLLADPQAAQEWLDTAIDVLEGVDPAAPAERVVLDEKSLRRLRTFREQIRSLLTAESPDAAAGPEARAGVELSGTGPRLTPRGGGVEALRAYVLIQLVAAGYRDTYRRLKVCANPRCRGVFYDRSKNCSRIWHDVSTCGNITNVQAYRARKRAQANR